MMGPTGLLLVSHARSITKPTTVYEQTPGGPALQGDVLTLKRHTLVGQDWTLQGSTGVVCSLKGSTWSSSRTIFVLGQQLSFDRFKTWSTKRTFVFNGLPYVWRAENHCTTHSFDLTQEAPGSAKVPHGQRLMVAEYRITRRDNELQLYAPAAALPAALIIMQALFMADGWEVQRQQQTIASSA